MNNIERYEQTALDILTALEKIRHIELELIKSLNNNIGYTEEDMKIVKSVLNTKKEEIFNQLIKLIK